MRRLIDILVFSSLWIAAIAALLTAVASRAMGVAIDPAALVLAAAGALVVYNVDRLRDLERDRDTTPLRVRFVERNRGSLIALTAVAAVAGALAAGPLGREVWALCAGVLALGLLHRRLKIVAIFKGLYITLAWVAVVAAVPRLASFGARHFEQVALSLGLAILANVIASSARDGESASALLGDRGALLAARVAAGAGVVASVVGSPEVFPLACVSASVLLALLLYRPDERFGLVILDGAFLVGALAALMVEI